MKPNVGGDRRARTLLVVCLVTVVLALGVLEVIASQVASRHLAAGERPTAW